MISENKIYYYIHENDEGYLELTSTTSKKNDFQYKYKEISRSDIENYSFEIKYLEFCKFDSDKNIIPDTIKCLAYRLEILEDEVRKTTKALRGLIAEASAMNKPNIVSEISAIIKKINDFLKDDFSGLTDIIQIETLTCAELNMNLIEYYEEKIYGI